MKRTTLFLFLLTLMAAQGYSQASWCPAGATWRYYYATQSGGGYSIVTHAGDTTVAGLGCQKLKEQLTYGTQQNNTTTTSYYYTRESNDIVYGYSRFGWDTIYNFNAAPGERWGVFMAQSTCDSTAYLQVEDTGHIHLHGYLLRKAVVSFHAPNSMIPVVNMDTLYERLGDVGTYFPFDTAALYFLCATDGPGYFFCNYEDSSFTTYGQSDSTCTQLVDAIGEVTAAPITVSPNPASAWLYISSPGPIQDVAILNVFGQTVYCAQENNGPIPIAGLPEGIYLVSIKTGQRLFLQKVVKQ